MNKISLGQYPRGSVLVVYSQRDAIDTDPVYQRTSGLWTREQRQLLIDSLINGFDLPKLYFHEFHPPKIQNSHRYHYAIIDGKQRLQAIWDFIDGKLALDEDFIYLDDASVQAQGLTYNELATRYPLIKAQFDGTPLPIVTIRTTDIELIEDLFSRLNEATPLNAPEKRNALGGPLPPVITAVAQQTFFAGRLPFPDTRYRHRDLAAKFLYIEHSDGVVNTKKSDLDDFVRSFKKAHRKKGSTATTISKLQRSTEETLALMEAAFIERDSLLRQVGMVTLYYHLFRSVRAQSVGAVERTMLSQFDNARKTNRERAEKGGEHSESIDPTLLEFDKHSQTPNDAYALKIRLGILLDYLDQSFGVRRTSLG